MRLLARLVDIRDAVGVSVGSLDDADLATKTDALRGLVVAWIELKG